jgi:hypothetical protein
VSIIRIGLAETKNFSQGYDAIFGKKKDAPVAKAKAPAAKAKAPAAKAKAKTTVKKKGKKK